MIIIEAAQDLYHFTDVKSLNKIIDSEALISTIHDAISFTRSSRPPVGGHLEDAPVRLTFDGNKLRHKFKVVPYAETGRSEEAEERVVWATRRPLRCMFALKRVDIIKGSISVLEMDEFKSIRLPIYFVNKF